MSNPSACEVLLGRDSGAHLRVEIAGFEHPDVAEPQGLDLLDCRAHAIAEPVRASFRYSVRAEEFWDVRAYLERINSGNGPPKAFSIAGGLFGLAFAPTRRGPVLCAVTLKNIDESHVRLEYMIALEPEDIRRAVEDLERLQTFSQR